MKAKLGFVILTLYFFTSFAFAYNEKSFKQDKFIKAHTEVVNKSFYLIDDIKKTKQLEDIELLQIYTLAKLNAHFEKYENDVIFYTLEYVLVDKEKKEYSFTEKRVAEKNEYSGRTYSNNPKFEATYIEKGSFSVNYSNGYTWLLGCIATDVLVKSGDNARIFADDIYGKVLDWNLNIFTNQSLNPTTRNTKLEIYYGDTKYVLYPTNSITSPIEWPANYQNGYSLTFQLDGYKVDELYQKNLFWKTSFTSMITDKDIVNKSYDYMTKLVHGVLVIDNKIINLEPLFTYYNTVDITQ